MLCRPPAWPATRLIRGLDVANSRRYWIGFNKVSGIGPVRLQALLDAFGGIEAAWNAPAELLRQVGLPAKVLEALLEARQSFDLDQELERLGPPRHAAGPTGETYF